MDIENTEESIRGAEDELQEAPDQQMPATTQQEVVEGTNPLDETSPMERLRASLTSLPSLEEEPAAVSEPDGAGDVTIALAAPLDELEKDDVPAAEESQDAIDALASLDVTEPVATPTEETPSTYDSTSFSEPNAYEQAFSAQPIDQGFQSYDGSFISKPEKGARAVVKRVLIGLGVTAGILLVAYVIGGVYFSSHFMPNTTVNGENVSGMSVEDLSAKVTSIGTNYQTHVVGDGIDVAIQGADIDYNIDGAAYGAEAQAQIQQWQWPFELGKTHEFTASQSISYDQAKLDSILDGIIAKTNEGATPPTNATMAYDEPSKKFVVVDQAFGTAVERDTVVKTVSDGVKTLQETITLGEPELVQPAVWNNDTKLVENVEKANKVIASNIVLRIAGNDALSLEPERLASWISMNPETDVVANLDAIKEWTQGELSERFDTVGTKRTYTRPDGKEIEVEGASGDSLYGWCLNGEELANIIAQNVQNGVVDPIEVPMKLTAASWNPGGKDWPNRYIDIDLSEQYVRMYDDESNLIWESSCVSGNPMYGGGTSTGVFYIYDKESPMILVGRDYDGDGQPDYKTPVDYWMPFCGGQGLHDANWRYYFGGNIFSYDGSHGCVNLPYGSAQELYGITNVGDTVIVHW